MILQVLQGCAAAHGAVQCDHGKRFADSQDLAADACVLCRCLFLETYNVTILDLLAPDSVLLAVGEDLRCGVCVEGLCEEGVSCSNSPLAAPLERNLPRSLSMYLRRQCLSDTVCAGFHTPQ